MSLSRVVFSGEIRTERKNGKTQAQIISHNDENSFTFFRRATDRFHLLCYEVVWKGEHK